MTLSHKVTLDSYSLDLYLFDIRDPENLRNKKKDHRSSVARTRVRKGHAHGHVTLTLSYKVTHGSCSGIYIYSTSATLKTCGNKKKIIALASLKPELGKGHAQGHVTLTHRVTLENYSVDFRPFEFHKQNYMHISSKIISIGYSLPRTCHLCENCFEKLRDLEFQGHASVVTHQNFDF